MEARWRQSGQSTIEYTVVVLALMAALFIPWNGEQSAVAQFLDAVRDFHANSSFALSLP